MKVSILIILLVAGCSKISSFSGPKALDPLKEPILYARYESLPALQRVKYTHCNNAYGFKAPDPYRLNRFMDLCGPVPKQAAIPDKMPWQIPGQPKSFHWEQDAGPGEKLQVEITSSNGLPWPSNAEILKKENRFIITLKPSKELPVSSVLFASGSLLDASGKKLGVWTVPFKITGF